MLFLRKYLTFIVVLILAAILVISNSSGIPRKELPLLTDSLESPNHIRNLIKYQSYYPFIKYDRNFIEFVSPAALDTFFKKIPKTPYRKLKILHIGDSHIQADIPTGAIRDRMQEMMGYGGRGLIFPFKAAATNGAYDYRTSCEGTWNYSRNTSREVLYDMGLIGATINTNDSTASFRFVFRDGFIRDNFNVVKIFCKLDSLSFDLKMKTGRGGVPILIDCNQPNPDQSFIQIDLPQSADTIEFFVHKTEKKQNFFECYGLLIETPDNNGVLYSSTGINGAAYRSLLKQTLFGQQLGELNPDLVVLDLGTNEFSAGIYYGADIEKNMKAVIDIVQKSAPSANIILSNAQDFYYRRKRDVIECKEFSDLVRKIAIEKNCAYYNYFDVAGGTASMNQWYNRGLAQSDKIHLTTPGYYVRGELFLNALLNSYLDFLLNPGKDSLLADNSIIDTTELKTYFVENVNFGVESKKVFTEVYREPEVLPEGESKLYYTIRSGDNLGNIAQRYGVTIKDLQLWNGLSGTQIIAGKTLVIYKKGSVQQNPVKTQQVQTTQVQQQTKTQGTLPKNQGYRKVSYIVKSGDTLWGIAQKYSTTVDAIKKANNLKNDKLSIGQVLLIP